MAPYKLRERTVNQAEGSYVALLHAYADLGLNDRVKAPKKGCPRSPLKISVRAWSTAELENLAKRWKSMPEVERDRYERSETMRDAVWPHDTRESLAVIRAAQIETQLLDVKDYKLSLSAEYPYAFDKRGDPYAEYKDALEEYEAAIVGIDPMVIITNESAEAASKPGGAEVKFENDDSPVNLHALVQAPTPDITDWSSTIRDLGTRLESLMQVRRHAEATGDNDRALRYGLRYSRTYTRLSQLLEERARFSSQDGIELEVKQEADADNTAQLSPQPITSYQGLGKRKSAAEAKDDDTLDNDTPSSTPTSSSTSSAPKRLKTAPRTSLTGQTSSEAFALPYRDSGTPDQAAGVTSDAEHSDDEWFIVTERQHIDGLTLAPTSPDTPSATATTRPSLDCQCENLDERLISGVCTMPTPTQFKHLTTKEFERLLRQLAACTAHDEELRWWCQRKVAENFGG